MHFLGGQLSVAVTLPQCQQTVLWALGWCFTTLVDTINPPLCTYESLFTHTVPTALE